MENAAKALMMAGGVLIALLILVLLVRSFTGVSNFQMSQLTEEEQEQLIAFNEQYTKYSGQYVYGIEVRSLINKYQNDNLVNVIIIGTEPPTGIGQDTKYYKCTQIGYDNTTGKVNSITFEEIVVSPE